MGSEYLTGEFGLITDYIAEAFHYQLKHVNRFEEVNNRIRLGSAVEGRDEKGIKKTVSALLKLLHPDGAPRDEEFDQYVSYAVESRRRVKEQMNKRKPDDEFAKINLSFTNSQGEEVVVFCPESKNAPATQTPDRSVADIELSSSERLAASDEADSPMPAKTPEPAPVVEPVTTSGVTEGVTPETALKDQHFTIMYSETGRTYESIVEPYLNGAKSVIIEDPYIRARHQITNFVRFCEAVAKAPTLRKINLVTSYDDKTDVVGLRDAMEELKQSLLEIDIELDVKINDKMHDREIRIDNGWIVKIGRGLDFYQKPDSWFAGGSNDYSLRKCLETKVDIFRD